MRHFKVRPLYFLQKNAQWGLMGIIATHVDDFWWAGTSEFEGSVIKTLNSVFEVRTQVSTPFTHLGFNVLQGKNTITLDLSDYVEELTELPVPSEDFVKLDEKANMSSILGKL